MTANEKIKLQVLAIVYIPSQLTVFTSLKTASIPIEQLSPSSVTSPAGPVGESSTAPRPSLSRVISAGRVNVGAEESYPVKVGILDVSFTH